MALPSQLYLAEFRRPESVWSYTVNTNGVDADGVKRHLHWNSDEDIIALYESKHWWGPHLCLDAAARRDLMCKALAAPSNTSVRLRRD